MVRWGWGGPDLSVGSSFGRSSGTMCCCAVDCRVEWVGGLDLADEALDWFGDGLFADLATDCASSVEESDCSGELLGSTPWPVPPD